MIDFLIESGMVSFMLWTLVILFSTTLLLPARSFRWVMEPTTLNAALIFPSVAFTLMMMKYGQNDRSETIAQALMMTVGGLILGHILGRMIMMPSGRKSYPFDGIPPDFKMFLWLIVLFELVTAPYFAARFGLSSLLMAEERAGNLASMDAVGKIALYVQFITIPFLAYAAVCFSGKAQVFPYIGMFCHIISGITLGSKSFGLSVLLFFLFMLYFSSFFGIRKDWVKKAIIVAFVFTFVAFIGVIALRGASGSAGGNVLTRLLVDLDSLLYLSISTEQQVPFGQDSLSFFQFAFGRVLKPLGLFDQRVVSLNVYLFEASAPVSLSESMAPLSDIVANALILFKGTEMVLVTLLWGFASGFLPNVLARFYRSNVFFYMLFVSSAQSPFFLWRGVGAFENIITISIFLFGVIVWRRMWGFLRLSVQKDPARA